MWKNLLLTERGVGYRFAPEAESVEQPPALVV